MIHKLRLSCLCMGLLAVLFVTPLVNAQGQPQEATLSIVPGSTYYRFVPENFGIGPVFIDKEHAETLIYRTLPPGLTTEDDLTEEDITAGTIENQFVMEDAQGAKFNVILHISNLIDGDKVIPFEQISMVTLSNHPSGLDSFNANSPPADTVDVRAPVDCPGWSETSTNLQTDCPDLNTNFFNFNALADHSLDPLEDITESQTIINVDPATSYNLHEIIEFADGEKALVTAKAPDNTTITVRRGALGTTPSPHTAGSGITGYGSSAQPVTIMEADEFTDRIGSYSIGFGFLLKVINTAFEPGKYSGIITIDISV